MPRSFVAELHAGPVLLPLLVGVVVVWLLALGHRRALTPGRTLTVLVATTYAAAVLALTFFPWRVPFPDGRGDVLVGTPTAAPEVALRSLLNVVPFTTIDPPSFLLNVVMTLPLGALLPLLLRVRGVPAVALVGLAVSTSIELGQGVGDVVLGMQRTVDVNDLVANVSGTVLGLLCFRAVAGVAGSALVRFALPGSAVAGAGPAQAGPGWLVDDPEETAYGSGGTLAGVGAGVASSPDGRASTATRPAASSAVPNTRSPSSAYGSR
ncbi:VanZ family protein [Microlunatus spumicola]|uniref:VanZ family protein n=1 Tax=Microlunatus spumicola TaxID=81499 RepID=UPI00195922C9